MSFDDTLKEGKRLVHLGRNTQRIREIIGMKQAALASATGMSQQNISKLEQSETIAEETLEKLAKALGVSPEFIREFNEERAFYNIQSNFNYHDNSSHDQHFQPTINNNEAAQRELYERIIADKDREIAFLRGLLEKGQ